MTKKNMEDIHTAIVKCPDCLGVARIIAGELKVVCMDGMEALSPENYDAFKEAAKNTDLQFFVTRVGDGPLEISAE